jgi:hypothetical protein
MAQSNQARDRFSERSPLISVASINSPTNDLFINTLPPVSASPRDVRSWLSTRLGTRSTARSDNRALSFVQDLETISWDGTEIRELSQNSMQCYLVLHGFGDAVAEYLTTDIMLAKKSRDVAAQCMF